jgi:hypothetical protein
MLTKTFFFCVWATLMSLSSAFMPQGTPNKAKTSLAWAPTGMDPAIYEMVQQTTPAASLAMGVAIVSLYEMSFSGRMENFSKNKDKKKNKNFQWTASGEA